MSDTELFVTWESWHENTGRGNRRLQQWVEAFRENHPAVLYWGDSWFRSPVPGHLAHQSFAAIAGLGMAIGSVGATAAKLFSERQLRAICKRIASNRFDAVLVSAGGNDSLASPLKSIFAAWHGKNSRPPIGVDEAFAMYQGSGVLEGVAAHYRRLLDALGEVRNRHPALQVIGHTYARICRLGQPARLTLSNLGLAALVKGEAGPWFWNAMAPVLEDEQAGLAFAERLQDTFRGEVLAPLVGNGPYRDFFSFVDFLDVEQGRPEAFWSDEIHPTRAGFKVLAGRLNAHLRSRIGEEKRHAVREPA